MDALHNLLEKYKYAPKWVRIVLPLLVGGAIGYYFFDSQIVEQKAITENAQQSATSMEQKFKELSTKSGKIQSLESDLLEAETMLEEIQKRLPAVVDVDDVLKNITTVANMTKVEVLNFEPSKATKTAVVKKGDNKGKGKGKGKEEKTITPPSFSKTTMKLTIVGKFVETVRFFDELLHTEKVVNINNIAMSRILGAGGSAQESAADNARAVRDGLKVRTTFEIVMFKSAS